ncbi:hypothetical protein ACFE04_029358 [Oxalis oulophora]
MESRQQQQQGECVKVVLVNTRYVETDCRSFKSVVQNLTGKDSNVSWIENNSFDQQKRNKRSSSGASAAHRGNGLEVQNDRNNDFTDLNRLINLEYLPPTDSYLHW